MREVATISNNNITLSDNMKSAVSAIIFASIISITTGETTVPTPYPTYATFPSYAPIAPTCTGSTAGWVDVDGADTVGKKNMMNLAVPTMETMPAIMRIQESR